MATGKKPHADAPTAHGGSASASASASQRNAAAAVDEWEWEWEYMRYMSPVALLSLAAAASPISQLTLAPVYGSIPSAFTHAPLCSLSLLLGFTLRAIGGATWPRFRLLESLTVGAFSVPLLQSLLLPFSGRLGPVAGPLLNGFVSCHSVLLPTGFVIADFIACYPQTAWWASRVGTTAAYTVIALFLAFAVYPVLEAKWTAIVHCLPELCKDKFEVNPIHLQLALGGSYALLAPSRSVILALLPIVHTLFFNSHMSIGKIDASLGRLNWTLVDRQWSNTGYISVLESKQDQYRVLRADHSLLGGEWLLTGSRKSKEGWKVNEPIYAVFEMLEAVRLLHLDAETPRVPDTSAHALVIGLGIGTAPKALLAHGINTTIVELDPVVHKFATQYFGLPTNHTAVLRDAVLWVKQHAQTATVSALPVTEGEPPSSPTSTLHKSTSETWSASEKTTKFEYIIHDVFTGGAEPLALFNTAFLRDLRTLLTPNGAIALNYAGDLSLPLTRLVLRTIEHTFDGQCKIYRDGPPETSASTKDDTRRKDRSADEAAANRGNPQEQADFSNFVVFCRNSPGPIAFRKPTAADYLGSLSRAHYMLPKPEWEVPFPKQRSSGDKNAVFLLEPGGESSWAGEQVESAKRHWGIMRKVMPDAAWELW